MKLVNMHAAKTNLSDLIVRVLAGEEIVIARNGSPVARLVPFAAPEPARKFGAFAGRLSVTKAFFEPLPAEELDAWER
jgi:prevent-host-death family protein